MSEPARFDALAGEEAQARLRAAGMAVLPLGAVEAHGPHLPTGTDTLLAEAIAREVARRLDAVLLPALPYGPVWSLADFPGSLGIAPETLTQLLVELGQALGRQGAAVLAVVNGHVGNAAAVQAAARRLHALGGPVLYAFTYPGLAEAAARVCTSAPLPGGYFHACEIETSLVLHVAPEAVDMARAVREEPRLPPDFGFRPVPWSEITRTGVLGDATAATAEKGRTLFEAVVERIVAVLAEARRRYAAEGGDCR